MSRENFFRQPPQEKIDEVKREICWLLRAEIMQMKQEQKEIAKKLGTSQPNVSRVLNRRIDELTINQLFRYLAILKPTFRILISVQ